MIAVYGLGNVLRRDDGFGPSVVRGLEARWRFPDDVIVRDLGTPGLDLPSHLVDLGSLVLVDTVQAVGVPPGGILALDKHAILEGGPRGHRQTTHEAGLREAILTADLLGRGTDDVLLLGAVPACLDAGIGLSAALAAAIGPVCARVLAALAERGVVAVPRAEPAPTGAWWEGGHDARWAGDGRA